MSRLRTIARNDFRQTLRDRLVWGAVVLLGVMFLPSVASLSPDIYSLQDFLVSSMGDLFTFSLIVIAAVGHNSITGERAEGTVRFVLGLPGTRRDFVLGKLLSRVSITILALGSILLITSLLTTRVYGIGSFVSFWVMGGWIILYGVVWTTITIGYSAAFSSQYRTLGALVLTYILFHPIFGIWRMFALPVFGFIFTGSFDVPGYVTIAEAPHWIHIANRLNPLWALIGLSRWSVSTVLGTTSVISLKLNLLGLVVVLSFGAVLFLLGLRRFERVDFSSEQSGSSWNVHSLIGHQFSSRHQDSRFRLISPDSASQSGILARGDITRAFNSWVILGAIALFLVMTAPNVWHNLYPFPGGDLAPSEKLLTMMDVLWLPLLILATAIGYQAVVGERDSRTFRFVLGLPGTRRDLVVGKLISRIVIIVVTVVPLLVFAEWVTVMHYGALYLIAFLAVAGWGLLVGIIWTMFAVGVSTAVSSRYRALTAILGSYLFLSVENGLWGPIVRPLIGLAVTGQFATPQNVAVTNRLAPLWFRYLDHLNPLVALDTLRRSLVTAAGGTEFYITGPQLVFSAIVIVSFALGTVYIGYRRFTQIDLG